MELTKPIPRPKSNPEPQIDSSIRRNRQSRVWIRCLNPTSESQKCPMRRFRASDGVFGKVSSLIGHRKSLTGEIRRSLRQEHGGNDRSTSRRRDFSLNCPSAAEKTTNDSDFGLTSEIRSAILYVYNYIFTQEFNLNQRLRASRRSAT